MSDTCTLSCGGSIAYGEKPLRVRPPADFLNISSTLAWMEQRHPKPYTRNIDPRSIGCKKNMYLTLIAVRVSFCSALSSASSNIE